MSQVIVRVRRLGGGFGGKGYRSLPLGIMTALAAQRHRRPVRLTLSRAEDMAYTGSRHPFLAEWRVGADTAGRLLALEATLYCDAGWSDAESGSVCNRALWALDGCYNIPHMLVRGRLARTNTASNTAFRGFGSPQGMFVVESVVSELAQALGLPAEEIRRRNMYAAGDLTHYGQRLTDWRVPRLWDALQEEAGWRTRRDAVDDFNRGHRWKKRGLAMVPTKFGIGFSAKELNQGGALVHILRDGSVLIAHGGVEMGQGIHNKMTLLAAELLDVPVEDIHISETSTAVVANTSATAGSTATDLNGGAVMNACRALRERLLPYRESEDGRRPMREAVSLALRDGVNLSANGFHRTPGLSDTWGKGQIFDYFTQGVAIAEVEVDVPTGTWTCARVDIAMVSKILEDSLPISRLTICRM